ncbi:hypothetical protein IE53DRAFT_202178 [Violaceomyces palustris]|uniref:Uncharacterized protein n=1 Tax=Violaceomyces palustris TaxID=1673888 RepID=A0ACD0NR80_9BASI|nr:hypothetical protein IE53DRAFT_202178 [Violaceomyces palustris]
MARTRKKCVLSPTTLILTLSLSHSCLPSFGMRLSSTNTLPTLLDLELIEISGQRRPALHPPLPSQTGASDSVSHSHSSVVTRTSPTWCRSDIGSSPIVPPTCSPSVILSSPIESSSPLLSASLPLGTGWHLIVQDTVCTWFSVFHSYYSMHTRSKSQPTPQRQEEGNPT